MSFSKKWRNQSLANKRHLFLVETLNGTTGYERPKFKSSPTYHRPRRGVHPPGVGQRYAQPCRTRVRKDRIAVRGDGLGRFLAERGLYCLPTGQRRELAEKLVGNNQEVASPWDFHFLKSTFWPPSTVRSPTAAASSSTQSSQRHPICGR